MWLDMCVIWNKTICVQIHKTISRQNWKKKWNPRLDSDWRKNKVLCVCVRSVDEGQVSDTVWRQWSCCFIFISVCLTPSGPRSTGWCQSAVGPGDRIWSGADQLIRFPVLLLSGGPELYLYTSESFEISVEFNSLCLPHQRKTPERFPHAPSERQSCSERLSSALC